MNSAFSFELDNQVQIHTGEKFTRQCTHCGLVIVLAQAGVLLLLHQALVLLHDLQRRVVVLALAGVLLFLHQVLCDRSLMGAMADRHPSTDDPATRLQTQPNYLIGLTLLPILYSYP